MSIALNKYVTALDYADKTTTVGITSVSIIVVFLISNGIVKMFLKAMGR